MRKVTVAVALGTAFALGVVGTAIAGLDFGLDEQNLLEAKSQPLFGVGKPLAASSLTNLPAPIGDPISTVTLASGLSASLVSAPAAFKNIDMIALWPNEANSNRLQRGRKWRRQSDPDPSVGVVGGNG